jgi:P-type Ca2+ transporter type 2C
LNGREVQENLDLFGRNVHAVPLPDFFEFMFTHLTHPFSLMAYLTILIYVLLGLTMFGWILLFSILLTLHINYFLVRSSFKKIKKIAEHSQTVTVIRNGEELEIESSEIVPFDVYIPYGKIPCNSVVL